MLQEENLEKKNIQVCCQKQIEPVQRIRFQCEANPWLVVMKVHCFVVVVVVVVVTH